MLVVEYLGGAPSAARSPRGAAQVARVIVLILISI